MRLLAAVLAAVGIGLAANNVAVDVQACGYNQTRPAAAAIVGQIAAKLAGR
jgi:hypothetical protein